MAKKKKDKDLTKAQMPKAKPDIINKDIVKEEKQSQVGVPDTQLANLPRDELMTELYRRGRTPEDIMNKRNLTGPELEAVATSKEFNRGGSLAKQMEMFEEGGLKDEGGSVDPVSGNDVPIGSTKEEVRDDIPAQLSEGEFVFPADVVRFIGLEKLMMMRQEAKAGLKRMEDMGQMGNADEATLPDDIPFTMDDLDIEEEDTQSNFNQGGVVSMAEGGTTPTTENTDLKKDNSVINTIPQQRTMVQQKPLNVRQQNVPTRGMVTNIPKTSDFLKKKTTEVKMPYSFLDATPKDRYGGKFTSKADVVRKDVNDVKQEIDSIINYSYDDNNDNSSSSEVQQGGIDYSSTDRFALDDNLRDVLNDFSKSQFSMFSVLTSSPFATFASAAGTALAPYTGGFTAQGSVSKAELGKTQATAFHQAALQIQKEYGLTKVSNINDWSIEAKEALAKQGRVALDFGKDIYYASVGKPYSTYSFNEAEQKSFTEKAKGIMDSIRNFGKTTPEPNMFEVTNKQKGLSNLFSSISSLAKDSLASKIQAEKDLDDTLTGDPLGDEDKTTEELNKLNFTNEAISKIEANGGVKEIRKNPNGTSYSVNVNGTFTHFDGTTVNFTDSEGNPGNAPKQDDTARKEQEAREQRERDEKAAREESDRQAAIEEKARQEEANRQKREKEERQAADRARAEAERRRREQENNNNDNDGGSGLDDSSSDYSDDGMGGWT
jgi:hypothetical protein